MSHSSAVPAESLRHLARVVGRRMLTHQAAAEIGETFEQFVLPTSAIESATTTLDQVAIPTAWHHQIRFGGRARQHAVSNRTGPGPTDWQVNAVSASALAPGIERAIGWIDANITAGDPLVHVLEIPSGYVTALWVIGDGTEGVVIADDPAGTLQPDRLYSIPELIAELLRRRSVRQRTP